MPAIRLALLQLDVPVANPKLCIVDAAIAAVRRAVSEHRASVVVLPESFNCTYDEAVLRASAEEVPSGPTCLALSQAAAELQVFIVGGSIVEKCPSGKLYITYTVWNPRGQLVAKYRKFEESLSTKDAQVIQLQVHLGDSSAATEPTVQESTVFSPGEDLVTFQVDSIQIGLGICWDMRFPAFAAAYRRAGCQLLIYPSLCDEKTGQMHWELLARSRALDNQMFVAFCSPARNRAAKLVAHGGSLIVDPWGRVLVQAGPWEEIVVGELNFDVVSEVGAQIPVLGRERSEVYQRLVPMAPIESDDV